ncbi:MAG: YdcF family protein [Kaiparowitsia implicata GSE-PSE-MK54-09C]|nr:YdcF family protein [Kaiparowitsia implicata GSE-PSE-MK54-09C]
MSMFSALGAGPAIDGLMGLAELVCREDSVTRSWIGLARYVLDGFDWVTSSAAVQPLVWSVLAATLLVRSLRRRRWFSGSVVLLTLLYLFIKSPMFIAVGDRALVQFLPRDPGQAVDAIVVLGRGEGFRPQRVDEALQLWQAERSPRIFASGRGDGDEIITALAERGVPDTALAQESCSRTTEENAEFTAAILQPQGVETIVLVTDRPHMWRSLLTFQSYGFRVIPHFSQLPSSFTQHNERLLVVRESMGLLGYGLLGRYFPREAASSTAIAPADQNLQQAPRDHASTLAAAHQV